jgi:dolichol kinase
MEQNELGIYFGILILGFALNRPTIYELAAFKINSQVTCSFANNLPMLQFKAFIFDILSSWLFKNFKRIAKYDSILLLTLGLECLFDFNTKTDLTKMSLCIMASLFLTILYDNIRQVQQDKKFHFLKENVLQLGGLFGSTFLSFLTIFNLNPIIIFNNFWHRFAIAFFWLGALFASFCILEFKLINPSFNGRRKFYHLLCVLLFTPAAIFDRELLSFSLTIALCLFIGVEYFRVKYELDFLTQRLTSHLKKDEKSLEFILAHIQLLLGCAIPIWMGDSINVALSGVTALGIGDSFSSIIGLGYGRHSFLGNKKTWEGAIGFVMGCWIYRAFLRIIFDFKSEFSMYFMDLVLSLVEASLPSSINDSLILSSAGLLISSLVKQKNK